MSYFTIQESYKANYLVKNKTKQIICNNISLFSFVLQNVDKWITKSFFLKKSLSFLKVLQDVFRNLNNLWRRLQTTDILSVKCVQGYGAKLEKNNM